MDTKICRVGTVPCGQTNASMFIKITNERGYLSISGVIGPNRSGNCRGGCGQICMEFEHRYPKDNDSRYTNPTKAKDINFAPGWNADMWLELLDVWKQFHLKTNTPQTVIDWLNTLPVTDKQPAWC